MEASAKSEYDHCLGDEVRASILQIDAGVVNQWKLFRNRKVGFRPESDKIATMITSDILNPLILAAFNRETTWLEASTHHSLDEFIDTFYSTRARTLATLEGLTDVQVAYSSTVHPFWSISESITHLIHTHGFYHNKLLDISTSQIPHAVEAARGFGEGARQNVPVEILRQSLSKATTQIRIAIEGTRNAHDADKTEVNSAFGTCNYKTWMLLMLAHEVDHLRQIAAMRGLARTSE